jgi:hypothetical protein
VSADDRAGCDEIVRTLPMNVSSESLWVAAAWDGAGCGSAVGAGRRAAQPVVATATAQTPTRYR